MVELPVRRPGDVNRHAYVDEAAIARLIRAVEPDVLDVHEEPVSIAARQWLGAAPPGLPVVMYTAQNVDKRYPPPFSGYERRAYRRIGALYPCSRQAASVARGKGFAGPIEVIPLGYDPLLFRPGEQTVAAGELVLALVGRLVPEKGVRDAVRVLARIERDRPARLVLVGAGPEEAPARALAAELGVGARVEFAEWRDAAGVARVYRDAHIVLVPSRPTETWVEQFGRVVVEAQSSGAVVAAYASGAIPEVAGEAALLAQVGDDVALAESIRPLDGAAFARLRDRGLELARTRTWPQVAERHVDLYRQAAEGRLEARVLPGSPHERRALARAEFGATAATIGGLRPFALPLLRRGGRTSRLLAVAIDTAAELRQRPSTAR